MCLGRIFSSNCQSPMLCLSRGYGPNRRKPRIYALDRRKTARIDYGPSLSSIKSIDLITRGT